MATDPVLVADIGGTNARFALARINDGDVIVDNVQKQHAVDFGSIRDAAGAYLESVAVNPSAACFAVAGPVTDDSIKFTNSPWALDIAFVKRALKLERLVVVNDFEALAHGVSSLGKPGDFSLIKPGKGDPRGPTLVFGPGTGLGQALIVPLADGRERIIPTEGGHVAFAPRTPDEIELMRFIARDHSRVSAERILSGPGLVNIYRALCSIAGTALVPRQASEITEAATSRECPIAVKAVDMFCASLGACAGDAVLATGARGGVVLGGGILPKIEKTFRNSKFIDRFLDKGRMRDFVEDVPIDLIVRDSAALVGAAAFFKNT